MQKKSKKNDDEKEIIFFKNFFSSFPFHAQERTQTHRERDGQY